MLVVEVLIVVALKCSSRRIKLSRSSCKKEANKRFPKLGSLMSRCDYNYGLKEAKSISLSDESLFQCEYYDIF